VFRRKKVIDSDLLKDSYAFSVKNQTSFKSYRV
jgi:hypothetical protein